MGPFRQKLYLFFHCRHSLESNLNSAKSKKLSVGEFFGLRSNSIHSLLGRMSGTGTNFVIILSQTVFLNYLYFAVMITKANSQHFVRSIYQHARYYINISSKLEPLSKLWNEDLFLAEGNGYKIVSNLRN